MNKIKIIYVVLSCFLSLSINAHNENIKQFSDCVENFIAADSGKLLVSSDDSNKDCLHDQINQFGSNGLTPLMWAIKSDKNTKLINKMLDNGADPNIKTTEGESAMYFAASSRADNAEKVLGMLLKAGGNPNLYNDEMKEYLIFTAYGSINYRKPKEVLLFKKVRLLLDGGANIDVKDKYGDSLIISAALERNYDLVYFLLTRGANISPTNNDNGLGLYEIVFSNKVSNRDHVPGYMKVKKYLEDHGVIE